MILGVRRYLDHKFYVVHIIPFLYSSVILVGVVAFNGCQYLHGISFVVID